MTAERIVVVGAGIAGHAVADELRDRRYPGEIVLLNGEVEEPYDRPPLSKSYSEPDGVQPTPLRDSDWARERDISILTGVRALGLDSERRTVQVSNGLSFAYDGLAICSGVQARALAYVAPEGDALLLRTAADARRLHDGVRPAQRIAIVGSGLLGLELAASLREAGKQVTVICRSDRILRNAVGPAASEWFASLHRRKGVQIVHGRVESVRHRAEDQTITLHTGATLQADAIITAAGGYPDTSWLHDSGVDTRDGILCNEFCETSLPNVVAAGDVAGLFNPLTGRHERSEHWTHAAEMGRAAARSLLGEAQAFIPVPYFWTNQFAAAGRFAGSIGETETVLESSDRQLLVEYASHGEPCGVLAVNSPREFLRRRRQISSSYASAITSSATRPSSAVLAGAGM